MSQMLREEALKHLKFGIKKKIKLNIKWNFYIYTIKWSEVILRWGHVLFAILWVGNSFLFNYLDNKFK